MKKSKNIYNTKSDAIFIGWQELFSSEVVALFNITKLQHPLYGSTVTEKTLLEMNLRIPNLPTRRDTNLNTNEGE
jgi:hypothetical protein